MSCEEIVVSVSNVSKCFEVYERPIDRLLQFFFKNKKFYKDFWALKDVNLSIKKGEAIGIIGRNGAGKSTLLQLITGILQPTEGNVFVKGRIAALLELGSGFNQEFTGRENVYLNAAILGFNKEEIDQKFDEIVEFADIGEFIDQPVKTYSSGMMVRLAFSVQVMLDPDILIIDEALAVGDLLFQKKCYAKINQLLAKGITFIFVTHDVETMRSMTQRALLLSHGRQLCFRDSPSVLLEYRKLLHKDEEHYLEGVLDKLKFQYKSSKTQNSSEIKKKLGSNLPDCNSSSTSFGNAEVEILSTECTNSLGEKCSIFKPGELIRIHLVCKSRIHTNHLNVSLRIRNRQGVKIYSWGTLNQDETLFSKGEEDLFWLKQFSKDEIFTVVFECICNLGADIYEIQSCVSYEGKLDYSEQRVLHWQDNASFFRVVFETKEYFFGGVSDMRMKAYLSEL